MNGGLHAPQFDTIINYQCVVLYFLIPYLEFSCASVGSKYKPYTYRDFIVLYLQAPSHVYSAHSSHVTNVSFTYNDGHLISTGGKDTSIIQWRVWRAAEKVPLPSNESNPEQSCSPPPAASPTENLPVS